MEPINFTKYKRRKKSRGNLIVSIVLAVIALAALTGCLLLLIENSRLKHQAVETMAGLSAGDGTGNMELESPSEGTDLSGGEAGDNAADGGEAQGVGSDTGSAATGQPGDVTGLSDGTAAAGGKDYTEAEVTEISTALAAQAADEAADAVLQSLKQQLVDGEDFSAILRAFYPEELVVIAAGNYHFIPISPLLKKHSYNQDLFILDENEVLTYQDADGNILSRKGIDVSRYQGEIDWQRVAGDGVEFAIIRLGIRGSAEGTLVLDPTYEKNMAGAAANDIDTGVYFFTQALDEAEAVEEAEFVLEHLKDYSPSYPVVFDVEAIETNDPRTKDMTKEDWTKVTVAFCERIKAAGYTPMIYGNLRSFLLMLDMEQLEEYEKWFAFFRTPLYFPYEHGMWQYSNTGQVDGINGAVDMNISMKDLSAQNE